MIKKIIFICIFIILNSNLSYAVTKDAYVEYNGYQYKFKTGDEAIFLKNAAENFEMFEKIENVTEKSFYLQEAMRYYFLSSLITPNNIEVQMGLGKVYDEMRQDKLAKKHFFTAIGLEQKNPKANLYLADFYYKRNELIPAIHYYEAAYKCGYANNYYLNYRLGNIYEKLADIEAAKFFYINASRLKSDNQELLNKIRLLDELNYAGSQYYLFNGEENGNTRDK